MISIATCTTVNTANVNGYKKYNVEKEEKNEYPKWKFIDPSGGEGGSFCTHFLNALPFPRPPRSFPLYVYTQ